MGKNISHAVNFFIIAKSDPVDSIEIDIHFLKEEIYEIKLDLIEKEQELERLKSALEETKRLSSKYYPEVNLVDVAKNFVKLYNTSDYYKGVSINDAINTARSGLVEKVRADGFDFKDISEQILNEYAKSNTSTYYDSENKIKSE